MTNNNETLDERDIALVRAAIDSVEISERLLNVQNVKPSVSFMEIYNYATQPNHTPPPALLNALEYNNRVRKDFEAILKNISTYWIPQAVAASSGKISNREIDGCRLSFRTSKAETGQVFITIEFSDISVSPKTLFICGGGRPVTRLDLPQARNGRIQLLLEANSEIVIGLRDINTEVFLR